MRDILKQSTASNVLLGPFVDDTDFKTLETALSIAQADIRVSKGAGTFAQTNNVAGATHRENAHYMVPLDTTDTNTLGHLRVAVHKTGALAVWRDFIVVPANMYDSLIASTDVLQVDLQQWAGSSPSNLTSGLVQAQANQLGTQAKADVNAEVVDTLNVDTYAEPGQGTPPATATIIQRLQYLYKAWRNRSTQDTTTYKLYNDDATTVAQKSTVSDSAGTFDRGEIATGP